MELRASAFRISLLPGSRRQPQRAGDRETGNDALRLGRRRAAKPRAIADGIDVGDAGQAIAVPLRDEMAPRRIEAMPTAQRPQELVRRHEAIADADGVDLVLPAGGTGTGGPRHYLRAQALVRPFDS